MNTVNEIKNNIYGSRIRLLLGGDINNAIQNKYLSIEPFNIDLVQPSSYDVTIDSIFTYDDICYVKHDSLNGIITQFDNLEIHPGQSILFVTRESFSFPKDFFGQIYLRSRFARLLNSWGQLGRIELGWRGRLVLEVSNLSLNRIVNFKREEIIATVVIFQLDSSCDTSYSGIFQDFGVDKNTICQY